MRKIQRVHDGDLRINEPSDVSASVRGSLIVECGRVTVSGHVAGDVVVESGKTVITGSVAGSVHNIGGVVLVEGTVGGSVDGEDSYTTIAPSAIVRNGAMPGLDVVADPVETAAPPVAAPAVATPSVDEAVALRQTDDLTVTLPLTLP